MQLDLTDGEMLALLNLLTETIETDRYPFLQRIRTLRGILTKFGPMGPAPPPQARPPTPACHDARLVFAHQRRSAANSPPYRRPGSRQGGGW